MLQSIAYARLPDCLKPELKLFLAAMCAIDEAPKKSVAIRTQSNRLRAFRGSKPKSLERKYYKWVEADRDWFSLVDKARLPKDDEQSLPRAFLEYWREKFLSNQRKGKPAWRQLIAEFKAGHAIPGYNGSPDADPFTDLPYGWSYANLMRSVNKPTEFETKAARIGRAAAAAYRPKVPTTRVGLQVGQYYLFDDMWHDFKVAVPNQRGSRRVLSLHAHDLLSACLFDYGHKPTMWNEEESKMEHLKESEMTFLLASVMSQTGYRPEGTVLIAEHGTAAVSERLEKLLYDWSGGAITVERSGIEGNPICEGMFASRSKGNFRFKAALESLHNLIHNETADMVAFRGQTGSNSRLNAPEDLHGRERYLQQLVKLVDALPEERAEGIVWPFLPYVEAIQRIETVYRAINDRTGHRLEGWAKLGFARPMWRLDPAQPWQDEHALAAMPPQQRAAIDAFIGGRKDLFDCVNLSPRQVMEQGRSRLAHMPDHILPQIFGPELGREIVVGRDNLISFSDAAVDDERMHFETLMVDAHGRETLLRAGEKYLGYLNPRDPNRLHICGAKGGYEGWVRRQQRICRADTEGLQRATGRVKRIESELLAPVVRGQRGIIQQASDMRRNNASVIRNKQPRQDRKAGSMEDFSDGEIAHEESLSVGDAAPDEFFD